MRNRFQKWAYACSLFCAVGMMTVSCSDDDVDYRSEVYLTGEINPIEVISSAGAPDLSIGKPAFNLTFTASDDWSISAHDLFNPQEEANWVKFHTTAGKEGSQYLGVYADKNTAAEERAAMLEISCKGKSMSLIVVQQAESPIANPNQASISTSKRVKKIEYYYSDDTNRSSQTLHFFYDEKETLYKIYNDSHGKGFINLSGGNYSIETVGSINKVSITSSNSYATTNSYAIVNGKAVAGYEKTIKLDHFQTSSFDYNLNSLQSVTGDLNDSATKHSFYWDNNNLVKFENDKGVSSKQIKYSNTLNDSNLDINYFIAYNDYLEATQGLPDYFSFLGALNLLGERSKNLAQADYQYSNGVTDSDGVEHSGLTATSSSVTIKVFYQE